LLVIAGYCWLLRGYFLVASWFFVAWFFLFSLFFLAISWLFPVFMFVSFPVTVCPQNPCFCARFPYPLPIPPQKSHFCARSLLSFTQDFAEIRYFSVRYIYSSAIKNK